MKNKHKDENIDKDIELSSIKSDLIPFAGYVDSNTILTKNGELIRTIKISSMDNTMNSSGKFSKDIRNAIKFAMSDFDSCDFSFWIHNSRSRNAKIAVDLRTKYLKGGLFEKEVESRWKEYCNSLNYYDTDCYVTILISCLSFNLSLKNIPMFLSKKVLNSNVSSKIKKARKSLDLMMNLFLKKITDYKFDVLKITKIGDQYHSPHLKFFSSIINFDNSDHLVPLSDFSKIINRSDYFFDFGKIQLKRNGKNRFATIFTIKDTHSLQPDLITNTMSKVRDVITCEIFHRIDRKKAFNNYKNQIEIMRSQEGDSNVFDLTDLEDYEDNKKNKDVPVYQHYVGFMLIAGTEAALNHSISHFSEKLKENGIIVAREDIGIERAFYSFLPGNFKFIKHANVATKRDCFKMSYSYIFDNENLNYYKNKESLFLIPTVNDHLYEFGILEKKPDVLLSSSSYRYSLTFAHFIALHNRYFYGSKISSLGYSSHSSTFMKMLKGTDVHLSLKHNHSGFSVPLFNIHDTVEQKSHFIDFILSEFCRKYRVSSDEKNRVIESIRPFILNAKNQQDYDELAVKFSNTRISEGINDWFSSNGKYNFLINPSKNFNFTDNIAYSIDDSIVNNSDTAGIINAIVLNSLINNVKNSTNHCTLILNNAVFISNNQLCKKILANGLSNLDRKRVCVIHLLSAQDFDYCTEDSLQYDDLLKYCSTELHFFDVDVNDKYINFFKLQEYESLTIKKLNLLSKSGFLKQNSLILPIKLDFDKLGGIINDIFCDNLNFRSRVARCIDHFKTKNPDVWLKYLFDTEKKDAIRGPVIYDENEFRTAEKEKEEGDNLNATEKNSILADRIINSA